MYETILRRLVGDDFNLVGDEAVMLCPVHEARVGHPDTKPSFYFNVDSGLCICFSCGYRANVHQFWADIRGGDFEENAEVTPDEVAQSLRRRLTALAKADDLTLMPEEDLDDFQAPSDYMLSTRGINRESAELLQIRSSGEAWILPVRHLTTTNLLGVQVKDKGYVRNIPKGMKTAPSLFGANVADLTLPTFIVESPLDVAVCMTHGVPAIATYGATITAQQLRAIKEMSAPILALDADAAGRDAQAKLEEDLLAAGRDVRKVIWPKGMKDPGDAPDRVATLPIVSVLSERLRRTLRRLG